MDPADDRPAYLKVASSIRTAILTGEFKPGDRLPITDELARFFEVSQQTASSAVRVLQQEGVVTARPGAGIFVREAAALPSIDGEPHELGGAAMFLHEMGRLKMLDRAGWLLLGVKDPESVAEHSFRVGIIGIVLAVLEGGADLGRTAVLCLMHDSPETRIGDIPNVGRAYVSTTKAEVVSSHQTAGMPAEVGEAIRGLVAEYEAEKTLEAQLAHDADKIETLLQAREYQAQGGYQTDLWQESSTVGLRTDAGRRLAQAVQSVEPEDWWRAFARSYRDLRRMSRGKRTPRPDGR